MGEGRTAEVFDYGEGRILKLFRGDFPRHIAEWDYRVSAQVARLFPSAPRVYGWVEHDGRPGIVFEKLDGSTLLTKLSVQPWMLGRGAALCADIHHAMHACPADELPEQKTDIEAAIRRAPDLPDGAKERILRHLELLPVGDSLCHGDFHPDNLILSRRGPVVIDWMSAVRGDPAADVARTCLILGSNALPPGISPLMRFLLLVLRKRFYRIYRRRILRLSGILDRDLEAWMLPLAAARLSEGNPPSEQRWLARVVGRLLDRSANRG